MTHAAPQYVCPACDQQACCCAWYVVDETMQDAARDAARDALMDRRREAEGLDATDEMDQQE